MPRIILLIILIGGLFLGIYLVSQRTNLFPKAAPDYSPQDVKITNLSDNGFTVTWVTTTPAKGFVSFGTNESLGGNAIDDRDETLPQERFTHHVTLKDLEPETTYLFKIGSGGEVFDDKGKLFQQKIAPVTQDTPPLADPVFGSIQKADQTVSAEALIFLQFESGALLSSFIREEGNWLITLDNARSKDLNTYLSLKQDNLISLSVEAGPDGNLKKDVKLGELRDVMTLVLEAPSSKFAEASASAELKLQDFNGDGTINIFDYVFLRLRSLVR